MATRLVTLTAAWKKRLFLLFALTSPLSAAERPNLVVLLVDAMGFADNGGLRNTQNTRNNGFRAAHSKGKERCLRLCLVFPFVPRVP
jgi:hypothetical protein